MFIMDIFLITKALAVRSVYDLPTEVENVLIFEVAKTLFDVQSKQKLSWKHLK